MSACTQCGASLAPGAGFCGACGRKQGPDPFAQTAAAPSAFAPPVAPPNPYAPPPPGFAPPGPPPNPYAPPGPPPPGHGPGMNAYPPPAGPGMNAYPPPPMQHGYPPPPMQQGYPPMPYGTPPPNPYAAPPPVAGPPKTEWKWSYSRWVGVMYGPIPVGIIIAVIVLIAVYGGK